MKIKKNIKAFTLIEMIIVIAIIAVLAAAAVPSISGYMLEQRINEANGNAKIVAQGVQTWLDEMETDCSPMDPVSGADFFATTLSSSNIRLIKSSGTNYTLKRSVMNLSNWKTLNGTSVTFNSSTTFDMTKYISGLDASKAGISSGNFFVCINTQTKTVDYAAWTTDNDVNWTTSNYLGSNNTNHHAITDSQTQVSLVTSHDNRIIGVYPFDDEI